MFSMDSSESRLGQIEKSNNMFFAPNDRKMAAKKHNLFWKEPWEKQAFHPDLTLALKAIQTYHAGYETKEKQVPDGTTQDFSDAKAAAVDLLGQIQFKNDANNCLRLGPIGSYDTPIFPVALRATLEAGFGPRFIPASKYLGDAYYVGLPPQFEYNPKKAIRAGLGFRRSSSVRTQ